MALLTLSTFDLAGVRFAVPVDRVQEVLLHAHAITPIPGARASVRGLMNVRGEIVTVFDARRSFDLPERAEDLSSVHILLRTDGEPLGLLVDEVGDVLVVDERSFERPPDTLQGRARELISGAYKLTDRLLLLLDLESMVGVSARAKP